MYSQRQIDNWIEFEIVRAGGRYNMFDPRARDLTELSIDEWLHCMKHYNALKQQANETTEGESNHVENI